MLFLSLLAAWALQAATYGDLPFHFEENHGQAPAGVSYLARTQNYGLYVRDNSLDFLLPNASAAMQFVGARRATVSGLLPQPGVTNYFRGKPEEFVRGVPHFSRVQLRSLYPGIDMICYGAKGRVEYDFVIAPGFDPAQIRFRFGNAAIDPAGDLVLSTPTGEVRQHKPISYQTIAGRRVPVDSRFVLDNGVVRFAVGDYNRSHPLVIDPSIVYSTWIGSQFGYVFGLTVDATGAAYIAGRFASIQGMGLSGAGFVLKLNPSGTAYQYINIIEGSTPRSIALTPAGAPVVTGIAGYNFPIKNAYQSQLKGESDMFLTKFTPAGNDLEFSTYFGGSAIDEGYKVKVDSLGAIYLLGYTFSTDLPLRSAARSTLQGATDLTLTKFNDTASQLIFSTYLGTTGSEDRPLPSSGVATSGMTLLQSGSVIVSGTGGGDLPLLNPVLSTNSGLFLLKLSTLGVIEQSTWVPGGGGPVTADSSDTVYVAGKLTLVPGGANSVGISRFIPGTTSYQTILNLGGGAKTNLYDIATDPAGNVYVSGGSPGALTAVRSMQAPTTLDAYVARITPTGTLTYGTYIGGTGPDEAFALAIDSTGAAYIGGYSQSSDFPVVNPAAQNGKGLTGQDGFVAKITESPDSTFGQVVITTAPLNSGLTVTVDGVTQTAPVTLLWLNGSTHSISTTATQGSTNFRYRFLNWSSGPAITQNVTTAGSPYTANFATEVRLSTDVFPIGGGTITVTPSSSDGFYAVGTQVTVTATPAAGRTFLGFTGALSGTAATQTLTITAPANQAALTVLANFSASTTVLPGLGFVPIAPCRLIDTRQGAFITGGSTRTITVAGGCGIPSTARAYSLNATVVPRRPLSYLTLYPTGQSQPFVSTLNAFQGQIIANAAIVPAGTGGAINAFATDDTELIIDVNGYFTDAGTPEPLSFYPMTPCRVIDTRTGTGGPGGQFGAPSLVGGVARSFPVQSSNCGIPANARAYAFNVTVVPPGPLDYITVFPTQNTVPLVSTQNSPGGRVLANMALVPAGSNGAISLYAPQTTDAVVDIFGYFAPATPTGLRYFPVTPCRIADTRETTYPAPNGAPILQERETRDYTVAGRCTIPGNASAYSLNATVVPPGYLGFLTLFPGPDRPFVSTLNAWEGQVAANAAIVPARNVGGVISAYASNLTHLVLDVNGYFALSN